MLILFLCFFALIHFDAGVWWWLIFIMVLAAQFMMAVNRG